MTHHAPDDPHAHLVGAHVSVAMTTGPRITGRLLPSAVIDTAVVRVDLGSGGEVMLRPDQVADITAPETAPRAADGVSHQLADHQDAITDDHWADARAVHEAAHAVVGLVAGVDIGAATVATSRTDHLGGHVAVRGGDAQALGVFWAAGPVAHAHRVKELGYGPLAQAAVDVLAGQGDRDSILDTARRGYIVWESQARRDAEALLSAPAVWETVLRVGAALAEAGRLERTDIDALVGAPGALTDHRIWVP